MLTRNCHDYRERVSTGIRGCTCLQGVLVWNVCSCGTWYRRKRNRFYRSF